MKYLLTISFLFSLAYGQIVVPRSSINTTPMDYRSIHLLNSVIPVYDDTATANTNKGVDSVGALIMIRSTGQIYKRAKLLGTKKWIDGSIGGGIDTIYVTPIGTAAGQIQTLYAVDGNLRTSRWIPGIFTKPYLAADSAAYVDFDTAAYRSYLVSTLNVTFTADGGLTKSTSTNVQLGGTLLHDVTVSGSNAYALTLDSLTTFFANTNAFDFFAIAPTSSSDIGADFGHTQLVVSDNPYTKGTTQINALDSISLIVKGTASKFFRIRETADSLIIQGLSQANDTSSYKPIGVNSSGLVKRMDGWAGGGGGSSGYSVTTAANTANYTVPTGRRVFVYLSDLTGQANRNVALPAATTGDEFVFVNLNTSASTFNWTFTSGTVKDNAQNTITTLTNVTTYHLVYGGTNYQIIN